MDIITEDREKRIKPYTSKQLVGLDLISFAEAVDRGHAYQTSTLRVAAKLGRLKCFKVGTYWVTSPEWLDEAGYSVVKM